MVLSIFPANLDWVNVYRQVISHVLFFDEVLSLNDMPENVVRLKRFFMPDKNNGHIEHGTPNNAVLSWLLAQKVMITILKKGTMMN